MSITVLGAGYAGIMAANRLAGNGEQVTLITPKARFVERIRLHAVASGARPSAGHDLAAMLNPSVEVELDSAVRIDDGTVLLASDRRHRFETLVFAVGSGAPSGSSAHRVTTEEEAERLRDALRREPQAPVTVVGAGLTGVEVAAALRAAGRTVRVVTRTRPERRAANAHLESLRRGGVETSFGEWEGSGDGSIVVDATGFTVPTLAADSGLPVDGLGRLLVDRTLQVPGRPDVYGAGDAVSITDEGYEHLRAACATAMPMGAHVADVILARRRGAPAPEFGVGYVFQCVDLGGGRGHVQFVHQDDRERRFALTGAAGGMLKEAICRLTMRWLQQERNRAGSYSWPAAGGVG